MLRCAAGYPWCATAEIIRRDEKVPMWRALPTEPGFDQGLPGSLFAPSDWCRSNAAPEQAGRIVASFEPNWLIGQAENPDGGPHGPTMLPGSVSSGLASEKRSGAPD